MVEGAVDDGPPKTTFALAEAVATRYPPRPRIKERQDLQRLLRSRLDILGEDLLFVAEKYGAFDGSQRRIDLLAVDRTVSWSSSS